MGFKRKKRRRYKNNKMTLWPSSNRYRYESNNKALLLKMAFAFCMVIIMFFSLTNKKEKQVEEVIYSPMEEKIVAFDVPPEVSSKIFKKAKNNNKDLALLFADYVVKKDKRFFHSKKTKEAHKDAVNCYKQFIGDLEVFPIDVNAKYAYENSWHSERNYGGNRRHYGTDIMDCQNQRGDISIVSMTSGVVENIGWNEQGGYRVGIRSKNGAYLYYAHLAKYAPNLEQGSTVKSGDLIGYMGDSGYGEEGTVGKFQVHLHVGIATKAFGNDEMWINPYYLLRYLEDNDVKILKSRGIF